MNSRPRMYEVIRKHRLGIVVGLCFGLGAGIVAGSTVSTGVSLMADDETREAVTAVKNAIVAGHKARDREALDLLYADDFTAIDSEDIRTFPGHRQPPVLSTNLEPDPGS